MCDTQRKKVVDAIEARQDDIFSAIRQVTPVCHSKIYYAYYAYYAKGHAH
jgi:hypothetical protein